LADSLPSAAIKSKQEVPKENEEEEEIDESEVNFEQLESIIDVLIQSLKDADTVIRWTAAKGIGRITQRLSKDLAD